jgi:hypothetical protein
MSRGSKTLVSLSMYLPQLSLAEQQERVGHALMWLQLQQVHCAGQKTQRWHLARVLMHALVCNLAPAVWRPRQQWIW